jgi:holo-[acyl-carrier protein] synthase
MIGIDVAQVGRLRELLDRYPAAEARFFTHAERNHCHAHGDPAVHFAGTLAAKEAVVKALGLGPVAAWARRIEITRDRSGAPSVIVGGHASDIALSISHDGDVAVAVAVAVQSAG